MDKNKKRWMIVLGVVFIIGLILIALVLGWFSRRGKAFDSRPRVLIVSPENNDKYQAGDGILVHATARENNGLARIELWVNDSLIDALDAEVSTTNLSLLSTWVPTYEGRHQIIVRATSSDGIDGQSMIQIFTVGSGEDGSGVHTVEEGETLESIAEDHGSSAEELTDLNPGLGADGPAPGDDLIVPDTEPASDESPVPPGGDGEPPSTDPGPPLVDFPFSIVEMVRMGGEEMVNLRLEVTALKTWETYDRLHCYIGLAGGLPQWYPDRDRDQSTDESFEKLDGGWWNTEDTMQGNAAPVIRWPSNQPLQASIFCVGTTGGTEAVEMEQIELEIPRAQWNGLRYHFTVDGAGGKLLIETMVERGISPPSPPPPPLPTPDPDMTTPTNVRLNEDNRTLEWDYNPRADELPIDGFHIYLNGNLQFSVDEDTRISRLPVEWFEPPCGEPYTFSVTAYRIEGDDWPESYHASVDFAQEDCTRQVEVTFVSLETYHLGGDGRYEERGGDVGPAYGALAANRVGVTFDQGRERRGWGGLDRPDGLSHNRSYNLIELAAAGRWQFSNPEPMVVTEVPFDGLLRISAGIMDRDTGRCRYEGDNGCDDRICAGRHGPITFDELIASDGEIVHSEFTTRDGRCRFEVEYRLVENAPSGGIGNEGIPPLPWLHFIDLDVDPISGETAVEVQNIGTGEWAEFPLTIELQTPDGASLGQFTFDDVEIPVDGYETVSIPATTEVPIFDICVFIDPEDEVVEFYERAGGALVHYPICPGLPDLRISNASYEVRDGNWLDVTVQNLGTDDIETRVLTFELRHPDRPVTITDRFFTVPQNIPAGGTQVISLGPLEDRVRPNMGLGYDLEVNPDGTLAEVSYENNLFSVREGTRVAIHLTEITVPYDRGDEFGVDINFYIGSLSGHTRYRQTVDWSIRDIDWDNCRESRDVCNRYYGIDIDYSQLWFDIRGDETLIAEVTFRQPDTGWELKHGSTTPHTGEQGTSIATRENAPPTN